MCLILWPSSKIKEPMKMPYDSTSPAVGLDENGLPAYINPKGVLGGINLRVDPDASAKAFANGTHILSPQSGESIDVSRAGPSEDRAKGIEKALDVTGGIVDDTHGVIRQGLKFLPNSGDAVHGLGRVTNAITGPLA